MDLDEAKNLYDTLMRDLQADMANMDHKAKLSLANHLANQGVVFDTIKVTKHKKLDLPAVEDVRSLSRDL